MSFITIYCKDATLHHQLAVQLLFHGREDCLPGHSWGPGLRDCYILHFIERGEGMLYGKEQNYKLERGQGFLITPNKVVHYKADEENPWSYCWIGFKGLQVKTILQAAGISEQQPIFNISNLSLIDELHEQFLHAAQLKSYDLMLQSIIYRVFSELVESNRAENQNHALLAPSTEQYLKQANDWIEHNYSQKFLTTQIAQHIGLNSSYLSRLFKAEYDLSLKEYITQYRVNRAMELLKNSQLTISEVSRSVGYTDSFVFSKMFKKHTGKSPSQYRQSVIINHNK